MNRIALTFYGLPALPLALLALPVATILPGFYAQEMGLGLATVGLVFLIARLVDAVSDPLIGWLSDSIPTRFGRRSVWITLGEPWMALAV